MGVPFGQVDKGDTFSWGVFGLCCLYLLKSFTPGSMAYTNLDVLN